MKQPGILIPLLLAGCMNWSMDLDDSGVDGDIDARDADADIGDGDGGGGGEDTDADGGDALDDGETEDELYCGDELCTEGETNENCPDDCPVSCGNEECDGDERPASCPRDCPANCGDGETTHDEECDGQSPRDCTTDCESSGTESCVDCVWECVAPEEECNGRDDDCDGVIDNGFATTAYWPDCDGDRFGDESAQPLESCVVPPEPPPSCPEGTWETVGRDCDDSAASVNPGASEVCNGIDDNCNGELEAPDEDRDGDGYGGWGCGGGADCDDFDENQYPGAVGPCDGVTDWDCDGFIDDEDEDGFLAVDAICEGGALGELPRTDCDDGRADVNPGMDELCGGVDENCDGQLDEAPALCPLANAAAATCLEGGVCRLDDCEEGFESCDENDATGCEAQLAFSGLHCGECDSPCAFACADSSCDPAVQLATGESTACAVTAAGRVRCWGYGESGQLGDGRVTSGPASLVSGIADAVSVGFGTSHVCAVHATGAVSCWGYAGYEGVLGDGYSPSSGVPVSVVGLSDAVQVDGGLYLTCALTGGGDVYCWGDDGDDELCNETEETALLPIQIEEIAGATQLAVGDSFACVLVSGRVQCWGSNTFGQIGNNSTGGDVCPPHEITSPDDVVEITAGAWHACLLREAGQVMCWGDSRWAQTGDEYGNTTYPQNVEGLDDVVHIRAGFTHTCALRGNGEVLCWGEASDGRLGIDTWQSQATPVTIALDDDIVALAPGGGFDTGFTCVLATDGGVLCWGANAFYQLGNGDRTNSLTPVDVIVP